ncbi:ABC transporter permease [Metasolibacillus meyeri]|uniref:ABC transporter permease n=1 Tax=Metasolibacillus meyeri TaxID=1071052 RepID=A0AAW9NPT8_9BACL|nr:ABC transporter permease [Metasolibacillus meyeri]MEC1179567.1 ABC transporter permease [Metasolibacillus meyeri]
MWAYFKFELVQFFKNKKNIAIYVLLLFATLFYTIKIAPTYDPIEQVDVDEIEARYLTRQVFIDQMAGRNLRFAHPAVTEALRMFHEINPLDAERLEALETNDLQKYAAATSMWYYVTNAYTYYSGNLFYNPRYYTYGSQYADEDASYAYVEAGERYEKFAEADYSLSINLFEQRTAWQTVERLMKSILPIVLIACALLLAVDIVTKDRLHPTLLRGFPIADWKKLLIKGFVAFIGSLVLFVPLAIGFFIVGMQFGFGNLNIPVPQYIVDYKVQQQQGIFTVISLGNFLGQCIQLLLLWFMAIITVVLLLSVLLRNEVINLGTGLVIIFAEYFYFNRGIGFLWDIENYPTSYMQIGQVVSKIRNFYYNSDDMSAQLGMKLLAIYIVITLIITLCISLNKRFKLVK